MKSSEKKLEQAIIKILGNKLPNGLRIKSVVEDLVNQGYNEDACYEKIEELIKDHKVKKRNRAAPNTNKEIQELLENQSLIQLDAEPSVWQIDTEYKIGRKSIARHFGGSTLHAEDINEIGEALKEYIDDQEKRFEERIKSATSQIYARMIGIFGVFVSIFSIIVISTDKMISFSPEFINNTSPIDLLIKSAMLFLPVGIVVALLVTVVFWGSRK